MVKLPSTHSICYGLKNFLERSFCHLAPSLKINETLHLESFRLYVTSLLRRI